MPVHNT